MFFVVADKCFDRTHGIHHSLLIFRGKFFEQRAGVALRTLVDRRKGFAALGRQRQNDLPSVFFRPLAADQFLFGEAGKDAAEIAVIEAELGGEIGRRAAFAPRQFVEDARLRERKRRIQKAGLQQTDLARVEAREMPHRADARFKSGIRLRKHGARSCISIFDIVKQLLDFVNYLAVVPLSSSFLGRMLRCNLRRLA